MMAEHQSSVPEALGMTDEATTKAVHAAARVLRCVVVTPEETVEDETVEFVALPLFDGEIGISPGHSPLIGRLGDGELRLVRGGETTRYFIGGGFVEVADGTVSVLTNDAVRADRIEADVARERLTAALDQQAHSPQHMAVRQREQDQARAQLRIARRAP